MYRSIRIVVSLIAGVIILNSCGLFPGKNSAGDIVDEFYMYQLNTAEPFPSELFVDDDVSMQAESLVERKQMAVGSYISHKKIGTNRRISMEGGGRKESVTFLFEVTGENGRTRETLMLSRSGTSEPFLIDAYVVEDVPRLRDPAPAGTSST